MMQPPLEMPAMPDPMGGSAAISTAMHAWTPATFSPPLLGLRAERAVDYMGEKASMFSFFTNFYTIILRKRGSALPKIMIEIFLATCLGVVAYLLTEDGLCDAKKCKGFFLPPSTSREKGHAMIGVLLAFLVVNRARFVAVRAAEEPKVPAPEGNAATPPPPPPPAPKSPTFGDAMAFAGSAPETVNGRLA